VSEVNSPTTSAKVKNGWKYTSILPIRLHVVDRENFTCLDLVVPLTSLEVSVPFQGKQRQITEE